MNRLLSDIKNFFLDLIFPISCLGCGREEKGYLCPLCESVLGNSPEQICIVCKKPSFLGQTHLKCQTKNTPENLLCLFDYHKPAIKNLVIKGKYYFVKDIFKKLGDMAAAKTLSNFPLLFSRYSCVTYIPLHPKKEKWRGFNQAEILAEKIAEKHNLVKIKILTRTKYTKTQKDLKKEARQENIKNAFSLEAEFLETGIRDQKIIIVDDVATTGSTFLEAASILKQNGAKAVLCVAIARD